jgi:hypothetical protein
MAEKTNFILSGRIPANSSRKMSMLKASHLLAVLLSAEALRCEAFLALPKFIPTVSVSQSRSSLQYISRFRGVSLQSCGRRAGFLGSARMATENQRCVHAFSRDSTVLVVGASRGLGLEFVRQVRPNEIPSSKFTYVAYTT